jgi:triphosphatase
VALEIELKLLIAPDDVAKLRRGDTLRSVALGKPVTRTLHSIYFDTPDQDLAKRGMALRLRKAGQRWIQTFKCGGSSESGLHQRQEFDTPVAVQFLDLYALMPTPAGELLRDPEFRERLGPVFTTRFRRTTWNVEIHPGETAELALDQGEVIAGTASTPISEVEIELIEGDPANLFDFAKRLLADVPLRLGNVSKAERGYALLTPPVPAPVRAAPVDLAGDQAVVASFAAIATACLRQLDANERGLLDSDDTEYVHQARVALRRLRSAVGAFRPVAPHRTMGPLLDRLRELGNALGGCRDWDVFLTETLPPVEAALPDEPSLATLRAVAESRRDTARAHARAVVGSTGYTTLLLDVAAALTQLARAPVDAAGASPAAGPVVASDTDEATVVDEGVPEASDPTVVTADAPVVLDTNPSRTFARDTLARRTKRVLRLGRRVSRDDIPSLHALRIEIKKLRYATEFFQSLLPRKFVRANIARAAELQAILGRLNDAEVTARLLDDLRSDHVELSHAAGIVHGWTQARASDALAHFDAAWKRFRKAAPQHRR